MIIPTSSKYSIYLSFNTLGFPSVIPNHPDIIPSTPSSIKYFESSQWPLLSSFPPSQYLYLTLRYQILKYHINLWLPVKLPGQDLLHEERIQVLNTRSLSLDSKTIQRQSKRMRTPERRSQIWFHISVTRIPHVWRNESDEEPTGLLCEVGDSTSFGL
jgi:hypothetical protein